MSQIFMISWNGEERVLQQSTLLHKPYLVKWYTKGEGYQLIIRVCGL